ncbi:MAG: hypothetical protein JWO22_1932 [Frankiales bacterium]|nr:hypothetical protein [Frankiales bacterium]
METSTAHVLTSSPDRYAKQLASHLGRKAEVRDEEAGQRIVIGAGSCLLECGDDLVLHAEAPDTETLERVKTVVASHLERFGSRNELVVSWA